MESSILSSSDTNSFIISSLLPMKTVQVSGNNYSPTMLVPSLNSTENNPRTNIDLDLTTSIKISSASTHTSIDSANANSSISSSNSKTKRILQSSSSFDPCNSKDFLSKLSSDKHGHQSNSHTNNNNNNNNNNNISDYKLSSK